MLGNYVDQWNAIEVKGSDRIRVLVRAGPDAPTWTTARLRDVFIPSRYGGIVLARERIGEFHSSLRSFHQWACDEASA